MNLLIVLFLIALALLLFFLISQSVENRPIAAGRKLSKMAYSDYDYLYTETDRQFLIGMHSWIVQDGNYPDFEAGNDYCFAIEFFPHDVRLLRTAPTSISCLHIRNSRYEVQAKIVVVAKSFWVIDIGVLIFQDSAPHPEAAVGRGLSGEIELGIDPFFYFERLQHEEGMPNLFYDWQINQILLETTPWIVTSNASGGKKFARDAAKERFVVVEKTNAWEDDGDRASYVFECNLLDRSGV